MALNCFNKFLEAGCDREVLLELAFAYVGGGRRGIEIRKRAAAPLRTRMRSLARKLNALSKETERFQNDSSLFGIPMMQYWAGIDARYKAMRSVPPFMRLYAEELLRLHRLFGEQFLARRVGLERYLVLLVMYVEQITGKKTIPWSLI